MKKQGEVALAFAGGGCRIIQWANIGRILENYYIKAVTGVSSGCFLAMNIAADLKPDEVVYSLKANYQSYNRLRFSPKLHLGYGLFTTEEIGNAMESVCNKKGIRKMSDFPLPIIIKATDAQNGDTVLFTNMDIPSSLGIKVIKNATPKEAIMASCAFPFVYKCVWVKDDQGNPVLCTDGGLRGNLCVSPLKKAFPELEVIGCMFALKPQKRKKSFIGILDRIIRGSNRSLTCNEMSAADTVIEMPKLKGVKLLDTNCQHFSEMLTYGTDYLFSNKCFENPNQEFEKKFYELISF